VFDEVRGLAWPTRFTVRALRNRFLEQWHDHDEGLEDHRVERERYSPQCKRVTSIPRQILAGEVIDTVEAVEPASVIVERIGTTLRISFAKRRS